MATVLCGTWVWCSRDNEIDIVYGSYMWQRFCVGLGYGPHDTVR